MDTATPTNPEITMGARPDGSPWVINVWFGAEVSLDSTGRLICDRKKLTPDQALERAAALVAAAEWAKSGRSAALEKGED